MCYCTRHDIPTLHRNYVRFQVFCRHDIPTLHRNYVRFQVFCWQFVFVLLPWVLCTYHKLYDFGISRFLLFCTVRSNWYFTIVLFMLIKIIWIFSIQRYRLSKKDIFVYWIVILGIDHLNFRGYVFSRENIFHMFLKSD
jgi:hypothetical protein